MFILQILTGIIIGHIIVIILFPLIYYYLPKTIRYVIYGEMKIYAPLLWFIKPTIQTFIIYPFIIILIFIPNFYNNSFFCSTYFLISFFTGFILTVIIQIYVLIYRQNNLVMEDLFEKFTIKNNFYKKYYREMKMHCDLGNLKKDMFDFNGAIIEYTKAIEIKKNYPSLFFNRGTAYLNLFDYNNAIIDFTKAIELKPNASNYYCIRATAKRDSGDIEGAIEDYKKAIELNPLNNSALFDLQLLLDSNE